MGPVTHQSLAVPLRKPRPPPEQRFGSYLDLDSVARGDGDGVAAVGGGAEGGARWGRSLDEAFSSAQVQLAGSCGDTRWTEPEHVMAQEC